MPKSPITTAPAEAPVVLTPPLSLHGGLAADHRPPNLLQRLLSLFRNVRPGSDLAHFQLPPMFNMPKSQLQLYGEGVYCTNTDLLGRCDAGRTALDRFASVVAWSISNARPPIVGLAPFNPVLAETHHASTGTLNVLLEQVSHHPPVSALHATDAARGIELLWCQQPVPRFAGASVEVGLRGKRTLRLLNHGETYEMDAPSLVLSLLPVPGAEWAGKVRIQCKQSRLLAELNYSRTRFSVMGLRHNNARSVKGAVFSYGPDDDDGNNTATRQLLCEIEGQWDGCVTLKHVATGEVTTLYDATEAIGDLKAPVLKAPEEGLAISPTESALVWGPVSRCILRRDWDGARAAKTEVEESARRRRSRSAGGIWDPKHFTLTHNKDGVWECWPKNSTVSPAPIIVTP